MSLLKMRQDGCNTLSKSSHHRCLELSTTVVLPVVSSVPNHPVCLSLALNTIKGKFEVFAWDRHEIIVCQGLGAGQRPGPCR